MLTNITSSWMNPLGVVFIIIIVIKKISLLMLGSNYHFYENCIFSYLCKKVYQEFLFLYCIFKVFLFNLGNRCWDFRLHERPELLGWMESWKIRFLVRLNWYTSSRGSVAALLPAIWNFHTNWEEESETVNPCEAFIQTQQQTSHSDLGSCFVNEK